MLTQSFMLPFPAPAASPRPADSVDLGVLTSEINPELVDEVIDLSGCREKRQRLLPARAVIYFVLGLCLFSGADRCAPPGYRSVMRWLTNGVRPNRRHGRRHHQGPWEPDYPARQPGSRASTAPESQPQPSSSGQQITDAKVRG